MKWVCATLVGVAILTAAAVAVERSLAAPGHPGMAGRLVLANSRQAVVAAPDPAADKPAGEAPVVVVGPLSVGDALLRPLDLPFENPTTLSDVQKFLAGALGVPVVLDLAALERLELDPEDTVQLDLKGVRLKTGLKLLLDQVELTWRVEAEDNLLIITDASNAGEPIDRALHLLKALHDEMHDLRDAVDDLRDLVEEDLGIETDQAPNAALFVGSQQRVPRPGVGPRHLRPGPRHRSTRPAPVVPATPRAGTAG